MPKFKVGIQVTSYVELEVGAEDEQKALEKGVEVLGELPDEDFEKEIIHNYATGDLYVEKEEV